MAQSELSTLGLFLLYHLPMANRSYLYAVDKIPTLERNPLPRIVGLSEFKWNIPLAHKILVGGNPAQCHSVIIGAIEPTSIVGEYGQGVANLSKFLTLIGEQWQLKDNPVWEKSVKAAAKFLEKNKSNFILLEPFEIFEMDQTPPYKSEMFNLYNEIAAISSDLSQAKPNLDIFPDLRANWQEELGIDYWSNILYFDFSEPPPAS